MIDQTILQYRILGKLGEGGMGVVYKARDTKLDRDVALKFLPRHLSTSEAEQGRLIQEAKSAAALNHPNVCSVIDLVDTGGEQFIVMEFVEGESLRAKIPLQKLDEVLPYAVQIGEALQEAHAKGIVHRDIKTDNIMINSRNQVKVMDFGLAKLRGSLKLTRTSSTVGTLAYMSPEQIEGRDADVRSDIFSFGVVLYEMLTGRLPFRGEHEAAVMYSIVNDQPESLEQLRPGLPPALVNVIYRAMEKDPGDRFQTAADMVIELRRLQRTTTRVLRPPTGGLRPAESTAISAPTTDGLSDLRQDLPSGVHRATPSGARVQRGLLLGGGVVLLAILVWLAISQLSKHNVAPLDATFTQLTDQPGPEDTPDISPDGNYIIYAKDAPKKTHIFMQRIGGGTPIDLLPGSIDDSWEPAFSPDGQWIAFRSTRSGGGIFIMGATGESVRRLSDFGYDPSWSPDGKKIVFATAGVWTPYARPEPSSLWSVNVADGSRQALDSVDAVQPQWSPHGFRIAYWGLPAGSGRRSIFTIASSGGDRVTVLDDGNVNWDPVWSPDGRYLYFSSDRGGSLNLWRVAIDERSGKVEGALEPITTPSPMAGFLRVSRDGKRVIYSSIDHRSNLFKVAFDPLKESIVGSPIPITQGSKHYIGPSVSPDGTMLAFWSWEGQESIYTVRADGSDLRQLTNDRYRNRGPVWSPDQKRIAFYSDRSGSYQIWSIDPDGSNLEQLTDLKNKGLNTPMWLPDGKHLLCNTENGTIEIDLSVPFENRAAQPVVSGIDSVATGMFVSTVSHDGRTLGAVLWKNKTSHPTVISIATGARTLIPGLADCWFSDNLRLLGSYAGSDTMFVMNINTGHIHKLLPPFPWESNLMGLVTLSPDDRTLYFEKGISESDIWEATLR